MRLHTCIHINEEAIEPTLANKNTPRVKFSMPWTCSIVPIVEWTQ
jgi:hypothetical protein